MSTPPAFGPGPEIELRCRIDGSMLGPLREFVCSIARQLGFSEQQVGEIEICVDEACANALEHAHPDGFEFPASESNFKVYIAFDNEQLTVRVIDFGKGSEADMISRIRGLEEYIHAERQAYRGLGLYLIKKYMDRVDVRTAPGQGTTVEMIKIRRAS